MFTGPWAFAAETKFADAVNKLNMFIFLLKHAEEIKLAEFADNVFVFIQNQHCTVGVSGVLKFLLRFLQGKKGFKQGCPFGDRRVEILVLGRLKE